MTTCPCDSKKPFAECCEPIIYDQSATTALALMRSRYSAYETGKAEYLYSTTLPNKRGEYKLDEIRNWSEENAWNKLEIISVEHGRPKDPSGIVEFKAHFTDKHERQQIHHERSTFLKEEGSWYYVNGKINPPPIDLMKKISRNDPCPCGSGKKHKKCCA